MKPVRIGLLWHSLRAGNLGVGALTLGNMAIIREVAADLGREVEFVVLSMRENYTESIAPGVEQFEIDSRTMFSPSGFWAKVGTLDCVIDIGAGDSFADIYGAKRFGFMWLSKQLTLWNGVPLILAPQTIGPFQSPWARPLAASVMKRAVAVVARDRQSLAAITQVAPTAKAHLAVDVAFKLPFEDRSHLRGQGGKRRIGINASGLLCRQAETGENRFGLSFDYLALHRRLLAYLCARDDVEVHLVTHANSASDKSDDDGAWADRLQGEYPQAIRVPDFANPSEAKSYISGLDFLIAGRMHACIAAFSSCTPVVPIAYSRKFSGLFGLLEYPWLTPVAGMNEDEAFAFVTRAFGEAEEMEQAERAALGKVEEMLDGYRSVLRAQLAR
ncbi:polysaccharide pyruvyl transferase family protein [Qipengyuania sp.]|uniref:polysaccharide pyruvyl transferase family protein n=1 Tax=Qipengyuania sp. TaxID=2004515 RepID=UPI003735E22C